MIWLMRTVVSFPYINAHMSVTDILILPLYDVVTQLRNEVARFDIIQYVSRIKDKKQK